MTPGNLCKLSHTNACMHACNYMQFYIYKVVLADIYLNTFTEMYIYIYIHSCVYMESHSHMYIYIYICIYTHIHIYIYR